MLIMQVLFSLSGLVLLCQTSLLYLYAVPLRIRFTVDSLAPHMYIHSKVKQPWSPKVAPITAMHPWRWTRTNIQHVVCGCHSRCQIRRGAQQRGEGGITRATSVRSTIPVAQKCILSAKGRLRGERWHRLACRSRLWNCATLLKDWNQLI